MSTPRVCCVLQNSLLAALGVCLALANFHTFAQESTRPDLSGIVKNKAGEPVTNASVFIYTAGPRQGVGYLCPSCYADCKKSARTDAAGKFKIESLDPTLVFRVLVVARDCIPKFVGKADPKKDPISVTLEPRASTNLSPKLTILGRVLDPRGEPVETAVVSLHSTAIGNTHYGSPPAGTDPIAVTDAHGDFFLTSVKPFDSMELMVEAAGFARGRFNEVVPGATRRELKINEGVSLSGKVTRDGKPLPKVSVGLVSVDRSDEFTGDFDIATRADGGFEFVNLPPNREYFIYGMMDSLREFGAIPAQKVRVGKDGSTKDVGKLAVIPGRRLAGQVKLSDGKPLPEHTHLLVNRREAWDHTAIVLPADGKFDVRNIPAESIEISANLNGYRHSAQNASLDRLNPICGLTGRLDADKTNLTILMEPGETLASQLEFQPDSERPENLPLCGIEAKRTMPNPWNITGHVVDAETKEPLPVFRITPGRQQMPKSFTQWQRARAAQYTNGTYSLELSKKGGYLVLMAEAEGYLPAVSEPVASDLETAKTKNGSSANPLLNFIFNGEKPRDNSKPSFDLELKKGEGPKGVLLSPDGKPADGVSVFYLGPGEQGGLDKNGKFSVYSYDASPAKILSDPEGAFDFVPKLPGGEIVAANPAGFGRISPKELATTGKLTLQTWGRIKGKLVQDGKPVAGEDVDLELDEAASGSMESTHIHLPGMKTGDDGAFSFERVPPGALRLCTRLRMGGGHGWTTQPQKKFTLEPGGELDLGEINKVAPSPTAWLNR